MEASLKPERLDTIDRAVKQLCTEQTVLQRAASRRDRAATRGLEDIGEQLAALQKERAALGTQLEKERAQSAALAALRCVLGCVSGGGLGGLAAAITCAHPAICLAARASSFDYECACTSASPLSCPYLTHAPPPPMSADLTMSAHAQMPRVPRRRGMRSRLPRAPPPQRRWAAS